MLTPEEKELQEAAEIAEQAGDLDAAYDAWRTLTSVNPKRPDYFCMLGRTAVEMGRWVEAEHAFLEAIGIDETLWIAMVLLGDSLLKRPDAGEQANARRAKEWLERAVAIAPHQTSLTFLGTAHVRLGEREAAKAAFRKVIEIDEFYAEAYFNLGVLLTDEGDIAEAEINLGKAVQLDPEWSQAHGALGIVLNRLGRGAEAERELQRALELDPADAIAKRHLRRANRRGPAQFN